MWLVKLNLKGVISYSGDIGCSRALDGS